MGTVALSYKDNINNKRGEGARHGRAPPDARARSV